MPKFRAPLHATIIQPFLTVNQLKTLSTDLPTLANTAGNFVISCNDQLDPATVTLTNVLQENKTQCAETAFNKTFTGLNAMCEMSIADDRSDLMAIAVNATTTTAASQNITSSITTGSPTVTTAASFATVFIGYLVTGTGIPAGTTVIAKASNTSLTLSNNATATNASAALTFAPATPSLLRFSDLAGVTQGDTSSPYRTVVLRPLEGTTPTTNQGRWLVFPTASLEGDMQMTFGIGTQFSYKLKIMAYDGAGYGYRALRGDTSLL